MTASRKIRTQNAQPNNAACYIVSATKAPKAANTNVINGYHAELQQKLVAIQANAQKGIALSESSRTYLYLLLADIYLLSREFATDIAFLEKCYSDAGIGGNTFNANKKINYRRFLRLAFGWKVIDGYANNKLGHWAKVMNILDAEFTASPARFRVDGRQKLANIIRDRGGITNIVAPNAGNDDDTDPNTPAPAAGKVSAKQQHCVDIDYGKFLRDSGVASIGVFKPVHALQANNDNLLTMVGVLNDDGTVNVLGVSYSEATVNSVAKSVLSDGAKVHTGVLKAVGEIIQSIAYPAVGKPLDPQKRALWRERVFNDTKSRAKSGPVTGPRDLVIDGVNNVIEYGSIGTTNSVTVQCKPKVSLANPKFHSLAADKCIVLEDQLQNGNFGLLKSGSPIYRGSKVGNGISMVLPITTAMGDDASLQFTKRTVSTKSLNTKAFKHEWLVHMPVSSLVSMRNSWMKDWASNLGRDRQLLRKNNVYMSLRANSKGLFLDYNFSKLGKPVSRPLSKSVDMNSTKGYDTMVRSKDIMPVLYNVCDIAIEGSLTMRGNSDMVVITYATTVGQFTITVPTVAGENTSRNTKRS